MTLELGHLYSFTILPDKVSFSMGMMYLADSAFCIGKVLQSSHSEGPCMKVSWMSASLKVIASDNKDLCNAGVTVCRSYDVKVNSRTCDGEMIGTRRLDIVCAELVAVPIEDLPLYINLHLTPAFRRMLGLGQDQDI